MQKPIIDDQYNRGEDCNQTVEEIQELADWALKMRDTTSMIDALEQIVAMCHQTQTDEVDS